MSLWEKYKSIVYNNCIPIVPTTKDITYWGNNLFATILVYLLPFCIVALIPGIYWSLKTELVVLLYFDVFAVLALGIITFVPSLPIKFRKFCFIVSFYIFSIIFLYYTGIYGPGLVYLLAGCIFYIAIFPRKFDFAPAIANATICGLFALAIPLDMLPWTNDVHNSLGAWLAVSSNVVFFSGVCSGMLPKVFKGMQNTILMQDQLKDQLSKEQATLKESLQKLELKNVEMEDFAYHASHDLKEPLRMIGSFMQLLEKNYAPKLDEKAQMYIHHAVQGSKRMSVLIQELLTYAKIGNDNAPMENINLQSVIDEIIHLLAAQIADQQAKIEYTDLPIVLASRIPTLALFQNLIGNALKYQRDGIAPLINITSYSFAHHFEIQVSDNGIGIAKEYHHLIFQPFRRLHDGSKYTGSGMGMAICKKIVEHIGGKIWVESEEGKGSTFFITFPKTIGNGF